MPLSIRSGANALGSTEDKEYFVRKMLRRATPALVHSQFGNKEGIPTRGGQSLEWRRFRSFTAITTALTEGTGGSETVPSITSVAGTVNQYGIWFRSTDIVAEQALDDVKSEASEALGEAAGNGFEQLTRNVINGTTTIQYASTAGSRLAVGSGMRLNSAELREMRATLQTNNAPLYNGAYWCIIHPYTEADLFTDTNIVNAFQYAAGAGGDNPLISGKLGRYLGIDFYTTSNATISAASGVSVTSAGQADVYRTLMGGADSFGVVELNAFNTEVIYHAPGSSGVFDPLNQLWSLGVKFSHTAVILDNTFIGSIEHTTSLGVE